MNETAVHPIGSLRSSESAAPARALLPDRAETAAREPAASDAGKPAKPAERELDQARLSNISLHFQVDEDSRQLTVFVIDRATRRVIRSIPASELRKLQAGELLKLTA